MLAPKIKSFGWHIQIFCRLVDLAGHAELLSTLGVPVIVDHFGFPQNRPQMAKSEMALLRRLRQDYGFWFKLSAPYRIAPTPPAYEVSGFVDALLDEAWPDDLLVATPALIEARGAINALSGVWWRWFSGRWRQAKATVALLFRGELPDDPPGWVAAITAVLDTRTRIRELSALAPIAASLYRTRWADRHPDARPLRASFDWLAQAHQNITDGVWPASMRARLGTAWNRDAISTAVAATVNADADRVDALLEKNAGPVEILNVGVNGWGPFHEIAWVEKFGHCNADLAIITLPYADLFRPLTPLSSKPYLTSKPTFALQEVAHHLMWRARNTAIGKPDPLVCGGPEIWDV